MNNITELREATLAVINDLRDGKIPPSVAVEMNNAIGKACMTVKLQLEYAALRKEKPDIEFMKR